MTTCKQNCFVKTFDYKMSIQTVSEQKAELALRRPIVLRTVLLNDNMQTKLACLLTCIAVEPNHQKCHVWNNHSHMTMLPMTIPDVEISTVWFFATQRLAERYILQ